MTALSNAHAPLHEERARAPLRTRRRARGDGVRILAVALAIGGGLLACDPARAAGAPDGLNLDAYRGKVVYLDFWASWCAPCKLSFPYMEQMTAIYPHNKFVVIAVNVDHSREKADAFISNIGSKLPVVYDPKGLLAGRYQINEMPTSILIGRDGRVRYVHKGFFPEQMVAYEAHISELLNEK